MVSVFFSIAKRAEIEMPIFEDDDIDDSDDWDDDDLHSDTCAVNIWAHMSSLSRKSYKLREVHQR